MADELPTTEIKEVGKFVNYFTSELPEPMERIDGLRSMIVDLKNEVGRMMEMQK